MIHREGYRIVLITLIILLLLNISVYMFAGFSLFFAAIHIISFLILIFVLRFFRNPARISPPEDGYLYAPADGKVVVIETTVEDEYFKKEMIQVSIFMSVWNVHINWFPAGGKILFYKYHPGKYLLARHPKSSVLNERNTTVLQTLNGREILLRQIAGYVARRVVSYAKEGTKVQPGDEMGFIKFGSRVDIFLPPGTEILVSPGRKVRGLITRIARID